MKLRKTETDVFFLQTDQHIACSVCHVLKTLLIAFKLPVASMIVASSRFFFMRFTEVVRGAILFKPGACTNKFPKPDNDD